MAALQRKKKTLLALASIALGARTQDLTAVTGTATGTASASACASTIQPKNAAPSVASGWRANVVASQLTKPRGVLFDSEGGLLVVEQDRGISRLTFNQDQGACVRSEGDVALIIKDGSVSPSSTSIDIHLTLHPVEPWYRALRGWQHPLCLLIHRSLCLGLRCEPGP